MLCWLCTPKLESVLSLWTTCPTPVYSTMSRLHKQMAWVADGYNYTSRSGSHRSIPSVVGFDEASIIIENASNVTSSDVSRNVVISRGSAQRRRVRSAIERRAREPPAPAPTPTRLSPGRRPFSASAAMPSRRRPFSGRSEMSTMTTTGAPRKASDYHKSFTLVNRWLQEWKFQAQVGATPTAIYPDRHARCHGHDHVHNTLLRSRPQPACQDCRTEGPARRTWAWPASVQQEYLTEHARYQSAHRPRTAPVTVGILITSWYWNAFSINGPLWWESTGNQWIPQMATDSYFDIFFVVILNKLLNKQYNSVDLRRLDVKATSLWREPQMTKKVAVVF